MTTNQHQQRARNNRLISVRSGATCNRCGSTDVAFVKSVKTGKSYLVNTYVLKGELVTSKTAFHSSNCSHIAEMRDAELARMDRLAVEPFTIPMSKSRGFIADAVFAIAGVERDELVAQAVALTDEAEAAAATDEQRAEIAKNRSMIESVRIRP